ncbi:MAG: hypothetical protein U0U70_12935 [Chitinophagaceae bacterium]
MRTYLILFLLFPALQLMAQPADYNGPARITVKAFWDGAAKLEKSIAGGGSALDADNLAGLKRKIDDVKKKDPSYSTSAMEDKVKVFTEGLDAIKQKTANAIQASKDKSAVSRRVGHLLSDLFQVSVQVSTSDLPAIEAEISEYKNKLRELLTLDRTTNTTEVEKQLGNNRVSVKHAEKDLTELENRCRTSANADYAKVQYYELLYNQAYWDAAQQVYPEEESFRKAYALATKLLTGLGSVADVEKMAAKSKEQKIKDCRLPAPAVKDAALEKSFTEAFNKFHGDEFKGTAFRAVITSDDWSVERNDITGIVTGRIRRCVNVYKDREGKCFLTGNFFVRQEYVGNAFTGPFQSAYPVMGSQQMLCENVK